MLHDIMSTILCINYKKPKIKLNSHMKNRFIKSEQRVLQFTEEHTYRTSQRDEVQALNIARTGTILFLIKIDQNYGKK